MYHPATSATCCLTFMQINQQNHVTTCPFRQKKSPYISPIFPITHACCHAQTVAHASMSMTPNMLTPMAMHPTQKSHVANGPISLMQPLKDLTSGPSKAQLGFLQQGPRFPATPDASPPRPCNRRFQHPCKEAMIALIESYQNGSNLPHLHRQQPANIPPTTKHARKSTSPASLATS